MSLMMKVDYLGENYVPGDSQVEPEQVLDPA
jgi:hypothetical protein